MAVTITGISQRSVGNAFQARATILLDSSYATGGYALSPKQFKLSGGLIYGITIVGVNAAGSGIVQLVWDYTNQKLMAFRVATATPTGTITGNVTVVGGGIGEAIGINPDTNAGVLSKAAATNRTIPIATFLGAAPTFAGVASGQIAFAEVSNGVSLSAVTVRVLVESDVFLAG